MVKIRIGEIAIEDQKAIAGRSGQARPLALQGRFWPIWTTVTLGAFADNVPRQALLIGIPYGVIYVPFLQNSDDAVPIIGALLPLAIFLSSPLAGQVADKVAPALLIRRLKAIEVSLMAVSAFAFATGNGELAILAFFAMGSQSAFFSPARIAAMPKYLQMDELVRGNGICNAGLFAAILIGYAVGGSLIVAPNGGLFVGAVVLAASSLGFLAARRLTERPPDAPDLALSVNWPRLAWRMLAETRKAPGVAAPMVGVGAFFFLSTAVTVALPLFARDTMNGDALTATALNALFAIGAGLGAIGATLISKRSNGLAISTLAIIAAGIVAIAIYLIAPSLSAAKAAFTIDDLFTTREGLVLGGGFLLASASMGLFIAPLQAAMQRRAPGGVRARIMATAVLTNAVFAIPGSMSTLYITRTNAPPERAFLFAGLAMLAVGAIMISRWALLPSGSFEPAKGDRPY